MSGARGGDDPLVRTYVVTSGRFTAARNHFDHATLIALSDSASRLDRAHLTPEQRSLLEKLAPSAQSVAELGAALRLPVSVLRILLADLMASGHITTRQRITETPDPDLEILENVLAGLRKI